MKIGRKQTMRNLLLSFRANYEYQLERSEIVITALIEEDVFETDIVDKRVK